MLAIPTAKRNSELIEVPTYFRSALGDVHYVTEKGSIITIQRGLISCWSPTDFLYPSVLDQVISGEEVTEEVFEEAKQKAKEAIEKILGTKI